MDTTSKYIKMCEEAWSDIGKEPEHLDWYYDKEQEKIEVVFSLNKTNPLGNKWHKDEIPLYRQDQLQEMVRQKIPYMLDSFCNWQRTAKVYYSMEQLWLAFVMHECYGKI